MGSTNSPLLTDSTIVKIAEKHKESVGTVLISYQVNRGIVVLPKSVTPSRIESNHKIITLDDEDMKTLNEMAVKEGKQKRFVKPNWGESEAAPFPLCASSAPTHADLCLAPSCRDRLRIRGLELGLARRRRELYLWSGKGMERGDGSMVFLEDERGEVKEREGKRACGCEWR